MTEHKDVPMPGYAKFILGGLSGMGAGLAMHPLDFTKTRMQMSGMGSKEKAYKSSLDAMSKILKKEGPLVFYNGGTAAMLRHSLYSTTRLGIYTSLFDAFSTHDAQPSFALKTAFGMFGGMCGGFIGTPADLCLIRLVSDGAKPPSERFNYKHVFDALIRITREEGVLFLWRGGLPTTIRAVIVNGTVLATYSQAKYFLLSTKYFNDDLLLYFSASMISGFISAVVTLPVDILKTRAQQSKSASSKGGMVGTFVSILKNEGVLAFWKGFTPYFARFAPATVLTFIIIEKLTYWYHIYILGNKNPKGTL